MDFGGLIFDIMPAIDEKCDEYHADDDKWKVVLQEIKENREIIAVAAEMGIF